MTAGAGALIGLSGTAAAARTGPTTVASAEEFRDVLRDHEDLLADLADRGLIESASADGLALDPFGETRTEGREELTSRRVDGTVVTELRLYRETERGRLSVSLLAGTGERFAATTSDGDIEILTSEPADHCPYCCGDIICDPDEGCSCTEWCYDWSCHIEK